MKVLLDTDVVLDFILEREPFFADANQLMELSAQGNFIAYLSAITPLNVSYIARKALGSRTKQVLEDLLIVARVCPITHSILSKALVSPISDYEDAVQHANAKALGLDAIVTRNLKDYQNASLPVYSPTQLLDRLKHQPSEHALSPELH